MLTNLRAFEPGGPLHAMTAYNKFLLFQKTTWDEVKQKWDKKPIQANGWGMPWKSAPHKLMSFDQAAAALLQRDDCCLGYVFTADDPFFVVDIDGCQVKDTAGNHIGWSSTASHLIEQLPGGVVEVSMSGNGLHILASSADMPHGCENESLNTEFYTKDRAMAITGNIYPSSNVITTDLTMEALALVDRYFPRLQREASRREGDVEEKARVGLERAREQIKFVDPNLHYNQWLAICMGLHAAGVDANMENEAFEIAQAYSELSPKYTPGYLDWKWGSFDADREDRSTLGTLHHHAKEGGYKTREEIDAAAAFAAFRSAGPVIPLPPEEVTIEVEQRDSGILYPQDYLPTFGAMAYIASLHSIWTPDGEIHDQKRFEAHYSGSQFALDLEARKVSDSPWEAFFKNRVYKFRKVKDACFRPDLSPGSIISREGRALINTYWPIKVPCKEGDISPFLVHLNKVLPNERDQRILMTYLSAVVQHPGKKFQWAPLLQGCEGNGKTFFTHCLEQAVGTVYTHYPQANDLDNKFNAWLAGKLLIAVEDVYVPGHRANVIEVLKPMITGTRTPIQGKGVDQVTRDVCANFIFNSNHRNALGPAIKGRRYCIFYTAQQDDKEQDLMRDGMTGDYFSKLYEWAKNGGFAHVTHYLRTYALDAEFNPAGLCQRAPKSSTFLEAIEESRGVVELEILAAVSEERTGFIAPWISGQAVDKLLKDSNLDKRVPRNRRRELIESLGYERHPHLADGRTNNAVLPDACRTTLYVKKGSPALELKTPAGIAECYSKSQLNPTLQVPAPPLSQTS